jgi:hypothetical protein
MNLQVKKDQDRELNKDVTSSIPPPFAFNAASLPRFAPSTSIPEPHVTNILTLLDEGDTPVLHAARAQAREAFRKNATMQPSDPALASAIAHAEEVAKILRENIVQGKKVDQEGEERYSEISLCVLLQI